MSKKNAYVDYQQRAREFAKGDLVFDIINGSQDTSGRVVAVFPAIGMVDVQYTHGTVRHPVEELQRIVVNDSGSVFPDPPNPKNEDVPAGAGTVSVPGGPLPSTKPGVDSKSKPSQMLDKEKQMVKRDELTTKVGFHRQAKLIRPAWAKLGRAAKSAGLTRQEFVKWAHGPAFKAGYWHGVDLPRVLPIMLAAYEKPKASEFIEADKTALYWASADRHYKATRSELDSNKFCCPRCEKGILRPTVYKRDGGSSVKLLACPECLFLIKRDDIIGHPDYQDDGQPGVEQ